MTLEELIVDVITRLGEAADTLAGAYMPGTNSTTPTATTDDNVTTWLNDAQNDLCRNYYPISDTATYSWPLGQQYARYADFVCQANADNQVFDIRTVAYNGASLIYCGRAAVENWYPNLNVDALATPVYYYADAIEGVGLAPVPVATETLTCKVIVIPAPMVNADDVPQIDADRHILLSWFACAQFLMRNTDDPVLLSRGQAYMDAYMRGASMILSRMWRLDPDFSNDVLAVSPDGNSQQLSAAN